jgi:TonB family protein
MNPMNRLQKKCVIGTAGIHLLLFLILIVGPAFYNRQPRPDDMQVLDVIPANLVDAAVNSGVKNAQPPPPTPVQPQPQPPTPPQPQYTPPTPRIVQPPPPAPPTPAPTPSPSLLKEFEHYLMSKPAPSVTPDMTPTQKPVKHQDNTDNIKIDLTKVKRISVPKTSTASDNAATARELNKELKSLKNSLSSSTKVEVSGFSSASSAQYAAAVKSIYERALRPNAPDQVTHNNENTVVKVTVGNDGTVISSEIISPSGDPAWDNAVQRTLNQVTFIAPFPDGDTRKERSFNINFNPQVEQSLE